MVDLEGFLLLRKRCVTVKGGDIMDLFRLVGNNSTFSGDSMSRELEVTRNLLVESKISLGPTSI